MPDASLLMRIARCALFAPVALLAANVGAWRWSDAVFFGYATGWLGVVVFLAASFATTTGTLALMRDPRQRRVSGYGFVFAAFLVAVLVGRVLFGPVVS